MAGWLAGWLQAEGGRALAKGLAANATLSKLSLAWNGLEEGAAAMGDMLAANMGPKHLDLSQCRCAGVLWGAVAASWQALHSCACVFVETLTAHMQAT